MLFLGAGASAAFGVPTLRKLTEDCDLLLLERGFSPKTLHELKTSHIELGIVPDFESVLTVLQVLASPQEGIRTAGPLAAYLAHFSSNWAPQRENIAEDIVEIKRMLTDKCLKVNIAEATKHYDRLFSTLAQVGSMTMGSYSSNLLYGTPYDAKKVRLRTQDIFTTNYDLIIERYFDLGPMRDSLKTGFVQRATRSLFNPSEGYDWTHDNTNLVKLHGSIDQFITDAGIEKRQAETNVGFYPSKVLREMMIFPVHEKYVTRRPWFDLYALFRERLSAEEVCIVIGYSFRDEAVNNAFIDRINEERAFKIVYIGGEMAQENIDKVPEIAARTKTIPLEFGVHDEIVNQLTEALRNWYPT